jgi:hypothetical protein
MIRILLRPTQFFEKHPLQPRHRSGSASEYTPRLGHSGWLPSSWVRSRPGSGGIGPCLAVFGCFSPQSTQHPKYRDACRPNRSTAKESVNDGSTHPGARKPPRPPTTRLCSWQGSTWIPHLNLPLASSNVAPRVCTANHHAKETVRFGRRYPIQPRSRHRLTTTPLSRGLVGH